MFFRAGSQRGGVDVHRQGAVGPQAHGCDAQDARSGAQIQQAHPRFDLFLQGFQHHLRRGVIARAEGHTRVKLDDHFPLGGFIAYPRRLDDEPPADVQQGEVGLPRRFPVGLFQFLDCQLGQGLYDLHELGPDLDLGHAALGCVRQVGAQEHPARPCGLHREASAITAEQVGDGLHVLIGDQYAELLPLHRFLFPPLPRHSRRCCAARLGCPFALSLS